MKKKRVIVHLDTGATREHEIHTKDEAEYKEKVFKCAKALMEPQGGVLHFTTPFCLYKIMNVVALEFTDPPPPSDKLPIGSIRAKSGD